jgi:membrane associated rhomboid family serine protease
VRRLVAVNVVVYLLTVTVFTGPWFGQALTFTPAGAGARPWTFLTYMFVHAGLLQLAVNMLMLLMFGPGVERRMGSGPFLRFFILCGLGGPALAYALSLVTTLTTPLDSASAAVFGVALAFALYWPQARVFIFPLPWPVPVQVLVALLATMALAPALLATGDGIAHLTHLGGFILGYAYLKGETIVERRAQVVMTPQAETPVLVAHQSAAEGTDTTAEPLPPRESRDDVAREMDRVLDKISQQGLSSLTAAERRFLDEMSRQMRRE